MKLLTSGNKELTNSLIKGCRIQITELNYEDLYWTTAQSLAVVATIILLFGR